MKRLIMSDKYSCFCKALSEIGYKIIPSDTIECFHLPEQKHADMQVLQINKNIFLLSECSELKNRLAEDKPVISSKRAGKSYPENIQLNFLYLNNKLFGKLSAIAPELKQYCIDNNIKMINVNQGYCRCSTLVISDNAVITADSSIEKALCKEGIEVLRISEGNIRLDGFDYGFIGGAGAGIEDKIIFFGNICKHPDYIKIRNFIFRHKLEIKIISSDMPLTDIGGIVVLEQ